jgi:hypothetical protein
MKEPNEANRYHIRTPTTQATYQDLEKWALDPKCIEMELCAKELAARQAKGQSRGDDRENTGAEQRYHIPKETTQPVEDRIRQSSRQELERWANDSKCFEMELCAMELAERQKPKQRPPRQAVEGPRLTEQRQDTSFNPRTEVSADAVYIASRIVKHLWIILVLLPFLTVLLLLILGVIK